jgi:hypothetical protein
MYLSFGMTEGDTDRHHCPLSLSSSSNPSRGRGVGGGGERSGASGRSRRRLMGSHGKGCLMRCLDIDYRASGDSFDTWGDVDLFRRGWRGCRAPHQLMSELSAVNQQCSHGGGGAQQDRSVSAVTGLELSLPVLHTNLASAQLAHRSQFYHPIHGIQQRTNRSRAR